MNSKRFISLVAVLLIMVMSLATLLVGCDSDVETTSASETLVVYNWEDYIDESEETSRIDAFVEYYKSITGKNIEVVYSTFDTNETMMTKVLNDDANSVDLICPSEYAIQKLMANGRLASITDLVNEYKDQYDFNNLHLGTTYNADATFVNAIEREFSSISTGDGTGSMADYMVPYMMGTIGILYNVKYVTEEDLASGWGMLWNASGSELLENKILVKDSVRDTYAAAVMYMREYDLLPEGYEDMPIAKLINCTDDPMLESAMDVLTAQREHISGYEVDFGKDDMLNEIVYVDLAWSGDALWAIEESYDEENTYHNPRTGEDDYEYTLKLFKEELETDFTSAQESYTDKPYTDFKEFEDEVFKFMYTEGYVAAEYEEGEDGKKDRTKIKELIPQYPNTIKSKEDAINYVYEDKIATQLDMILMFWAEAVF